MQEVEIVLDGAEPQEDWDPAAVREPPAGSSSGRMELMPKVLEFTVVSPAMISTATMLNRCSTSLLIVFLLTP